MIQVDRSWITDEEAVIWVIEMKGLSPHQFCLFSTLREEQEHNQYILYEFFFYKSQ